MKVNYADFQNIIIYIYIQRKFTRDNKFGYRYTHTRGRATRILFRTIVCNNITVIVLRFGGHGRFQRPEMAVRGGFARQISTIDPHCTYNYFNSVYNNIVVLCICATVENSYDQRINGRRHLLNCGAITRIGAFYCY